jgi:LacI family transcriptional regulator
MARLSESMNTIHDVAKRAGVSASSVSRALNGHPNVSPQLRRRVEEAVRELRYQPNLAAHSLRSGATGLVGFLLDSMANGPIYASVEQALRNQGYSMLLTNTENDPHLNSAFLQLMAQRRVDGLLIDSSIAGQQQVIDDLERLHLPAVLFDSDIPENTPHLSAIRSDYSGGMRAAIGHLTAQGHRRIALICGQSWWWPARERLSAFQSACAAAGLPPEPGLVRSVTMSAANAYAETVALLTASVPPTALIVGGNNLLLGVLRALQAHQCVAGRDLALIGADDLDLTQLYSPPITVIARDLARLGEMAVQLLSETIRSGAGQAVTLPTQLIVRNSSTAGLAAS